MLEAVKQNGSSLKYVKEQKNEMCLEAVKENGPVGSIRICKRTK